MAPKLAVLLALAIAAAAMVVNPSQAQNSPEDYVAPHNTARAVGVGPVSWSTKLQSYAQSYANQRVGDCNLQNSGGPYGENIFRGGAGVAWKAADAVNLWVGEKKDYDDGSNSCAAGRQCGHYMQVVWRASTTIGCARVVCDGNRGVLFVCSYDPRGNIVGQTPY